MPDHAEALMDAILRVLEQQPTVKPIIVDRDAWIDEKWEDERKYLPTTDADDDAPRA